MPNTMMVDEKEAKKRFGTLVREVLRKNGWSYNICGDFLGVSHVAVMNWVHEKTLPEPRTLQRFAELTGYDSVDLFIMVGYFSEESREKYGKILRDGGGDNKIDEFIRLLNVSSDDEKNAVIEMARSFLSILRGKNETTKRKR